jgi:hypothetical protein
VGEVIFLLPLAAWRITQLIVYSACNIESAEHALHPLSRERQKQNPHLQFSPASA